MSEKIICIDDLPFRLSEQESDLLMSKIPSNIAAIGREWGYNDTVFRDNLFEHIVKKILGFEDVDAYYESEVFKNYHEKRQILSNEILIGKTSKFKITFGIVYYDKDFNQISTTGSFEIIAIDFDTARDNSFFELSRYILKAGYVLRKLEVLLINEI